MIQSPLAKIAARIASVAPYTGGPQRDFERVGRDCFITLLENGLRPDHKLLDLGCGALRLGYWFVRFLDAGNYCGIEPVAKMLEPGKLYSLGEELIAAKRPRFSNNAECEFGSFGVRFDFVVARSILTHTTPGMLRKILSEFSRHAAPGGKFIASYWRKGDPIPKQFEDGDRLPLDDWRFIRYVKYSLPKLAEWAEEARLKVEELSARPVVNNQVWLKFEAADTQPDLG
jgi:SAM-dependent methyltransferase